MGETGERQFFPTRDARRPRHRIGIGDRIAQRRVPCVGAPGGLWPALAKIVEAHPRADDQHALVAQRRQRAPDRNMRGGIEVLAQRDLGERDVGTRHRDHHRDEHAVVPAARGLLADREARAADQRRCPPRDTGRARRGPLQPVGVLGEAVIVVEQGLAVPDMDGDVRGFPMARHQQDRLWPFGQRLDQPGEIGLHRPPHRIGRAVRVHEEAGAAAMRDEERGKGHDRDIGLRSPADNRATRKHAVSQARPFD